MFSIFSTLLAAYLTCDFFPKFPSRIFLRNPRELVFYANIQDYLLYILIILYSNIKYRLFDTTVDCPFFNIRISIHSTQRHIFFNKKIYTRNLKPFVFMPLKFFSNEALKILCMYIVQTLVVIFA